MALLCVQIFHLFQTLSYIEIKLYNSIQFYTVMHITANFSKFIPQFECFTQKKQCKLLAENLLWVVTSFKLKIFRKYIY